VVGGQRRKTGKSSVVAGLIAALREFDWTAIKITRHAHGEGWGITEERERANTDTGRFLLAGARRAFWIRAPQTAFAEVAGEVRRMAAGHNTIVESNSIAHFLHPDLALMVLDSEERECKPSAAPLMERADAFIVARGGALPTVRRGVECFVVAPPQYVTAEIADFVRSRLSS
jgi:hypothetical protein